MYRYMLGSHMAAFFCAARSWGPQKCRNARRLVVREAGQVGVPAKGRLDQGQDLPPGRDRGHCRPIDFCITALLWRKEYCFPADRQDQYGFL